MTTTTTELSLPEIEQRRQEIDTEVEQRAATVQSLIDRAQDGYRDLNDQERATCAAETAKLQSLRGELTQLEERSHHLQVEQRSRQIGDAIARMTGQADREAGVPPLLPSRRQFSDMRASFADEPRPLRFETEIETRAVVTLAGDAGTPVGTLGAPSLPEPRRIATAAGIPVERVAGVENVTFPVFGAGTAGIAAENAAKTEYDVISPGTAVPQVVNAYTDYTRQLALSHGAFEQRLRQKLATLVAAREDVLLQAKVMGTTGIQTQAFVAGAQANQVLVGAAKVENAVGLPPDVALVNPADIGLLLGAGIANTPPGELAQLDLQLFGMRLYVTSAQTAGFVLVGAWRASSRMVIGMGPTYFVDPYSGLKNNGITTLLEEAVDLAVEEPAGFISIDIITP
jgi:Phage capsid family